jgi:hypothetical protein
MRKRLFPLLIAISALSVSASAAFYSVFGLSKLFAGASYQVMVMAGSLEFAKLVVASLLYQYWGTLNKILRIYLSTAVLILILITSAGIYGFLSGAYQSTATQSEIVGKELAVIEMKRTRFEEKKNELKIEKQQLNTSVNDLRLSLSNPSQVQYIDRQSGQLITTTSSSARRTLKKELDMTIKDRDTLAIQIETVIDSLSQLDIRVLNKETSNEAEMELGPLKYISELTGKPMSQIINWLLLLIIFVFDPLAIAMVIAANFAFSRLNKRESETLPPSVPVKVMEEPLNEDKLMELSTLIGKEENKHQPIKPNREDLKKLEEVLGLDKVKKNETNKENKEMGQKTSSMEFQNDEEDVSLITDPAHKKKILKYVKRGGHQIE